jgi:hypothetical protein
MSENNQELNDGMAMDPGEIQMESDSPSQENPQEAGDSANNPAEGEADDPENAEEEAEAGKIPDSNEEEKNHEDVENAENPENFENIENAENQENDLNPDANQQEEHYNYSHSMDKSVDNRDSENPCLFWMLEKMVNASFLNSKTDQKITDEIKADMIRFVNEDDKNMNTLYIKYSKTTMVTTASFALDKIPDPQENEFNLCFFVKKDTSMSINIFNIEILLVFDYIDGNVNKYLLEQMNEKYVPYILYQLKWPEGIKKELITNLHKFMISLSHTYYSEKKQIVLYIPKENFSDLDAVLKDKDLVSRLETIMIEWTTQIRDFLNNQESLTNTEDFDVSSEIEFWNLRNANLENISLQLENQELQRIIDILEKVRAQSDNLKGFVNLKKNILDERRRALEIQKFLKLLHEPCQQINKTEVKELPTILQKMIDRIRIISFCESYNTTEKVADLIKKVSIQLIHKFIYKIKENIGNIKTEYNQQLHTDIKLIKLCINEWRKIFNQTKERVKLREEDRNVAERWNFSQNDHQNIFYDLEAFEKRCQNLDEICLCQLQFGKNKKDIQPIFGGTKKYEIYKQLKDIEEKFDDQMKILFHPDNRVEDIKVNKWQEDYRLFSKHIEDLEDMYKNTISSAFKRVNTLEDAVNYVENFYSMAKLPKIKMFIKSDIALEVIELLFSELNKMKAKNETKGFYRGLKMTQEGSNTMWSKFLTLRLEDYSKAIQKMNLIFNPKNVKEEHPYLKSKKTEDVRQSMKNLAAILKSYLQGEVPGVKEELEYILKINDQVLDEKLKIPLLIKYESPIEKP